MRIKENECKKFDDEQEKLKHCLIVNGRMRQRAYDVDIKLNHDMYDYKNPTRLIVHVVNHKPWKKITYESMPKSHLWESRYKEV